MPIKIYKKQTFNKIFLYFENTKLKPRFLAFMYNQTTNNHTTLNSTTHTPLTPDLKPPI